MGKPKFSRKKYETPSHPWQEQRIQEENELIKKYGLKNKKEIWKAETVLRRVRGQARELLASIGTGDEQSKKESSQLINRLSRLNILPANATLDDVLALETESILNRRLQTIAYLKGFAQTPKQARQLISHGHISINGKRITVPGYMVTKKEESDIDYTGDSPLIDSMHPARPKSDFKSIPKKKEEAKTEKPKEEKKESKETEKPKDENTKNQNQEEKELVKKEDDKQDKPETEKPAEIKEIKEDEKAKKQEEKEPKQEENSDSIEDKSKSEKISEKEDQIDEKQDADKKENKNEDIKDKGGK